MARIWGLATMATIVGFSHLGVDLALGAVVNVGLATVAGTAGPATMANIASAKS